MIGKADELRVAMAGGLTVERLSDFVGPHANYHWAISETGVTVAKRAVGTLLRHDELLPIQHDLTGAPMQYTLRP